MLARGGVQRALAILSRILRETMMSLGSGGDLMAEANSGETEAVEGSARGFLSLALGFWSGPTRRAALLWSVGALVLVFCDLAVNVGLNHWNRWFFDALERKQGDTLLLTVGVFLMLILVGAALAMVTFKMTLQLLWGEWLTGELARRWLTDQRYCRLEIANEQGLSPEYRLADDVRLATEPVVDFSIGLINALLSAVTLVWILLVVGGSDASRYPATSRSRRYCTPSRYRPAHSSSAGHSSAKSQTRTRRRPGSATS